jgi:hypothetical protein
MKETIYLSLMDVGNSPSCLLNGKRIAMQNLMMGLPIAMKNWLLICGRAAVGTSHGFPSWLVVDHPTSF